MIFHVDANSFYASCERLFRPDLADKPIVVLSNNDGIIIALNAEAKAKGFSRGDAWFKVACRADAEGVTAFSSNYTLYADISARIVSVYNRLCPDVEIYSIDECFLYYPDWDCPDYEEIARHLRSTVLREIGIPVSVGIAPTRTLAKTANKLAKKAGGVYLMRSESIDQELAKIPVRDVWGIGWAKGADLERRGVKTALDLKRYPLHLAKKQLTITGMRTIQELSGIPAIDRQERESNRNICTSKSFAEPVYALEDLEQALSSYTQEAVKRLRDQGSRATFISVFLMTNPWDDSGPQYCNLSSARLPRPTSYLPEIQRAAMDLLGKLYREGPRYRKVMINLLGLEEDRDIQPSLFGDDEGSPEESDAREHADCIQSADLLKSTQRSEPADSMESGDPATARFSATASFSESAIPTGVARVNERLIALHPKRTVSSLMSCFDGINRKYGRETLMLARNVGEGRAWQMRRRMLSPAYTTDVASLPDVH